MEYSKIINKKIDDTFNKDDSSVKQKSLMNVMKKILLVDDDQLLHDMYSMKFKKNGFEVKTASDGEEAIQIIKDGYVPDVLITDLMMPVMDGFGIFEAIKKENLAPNIIAIMLTNKGLSEEINKAKEEGFHGYIVKATTIPAGVVEEVKKICESHCNNF
jgi:two-component system chemotaxis response regulator CheY